MTMTNTMTNTQILDWINARTPDGSYYNHELERLLALVSSLPDKARVVEIGVYGGRTAAVYLLQQVRRFELWQKRPDAGQPDYSGTDKEEKWWCADHAFDLHLIDLWVLNESDSRPGYEKLKADVMKLLPLPIAEHWKSSQSAAAEIPDGIDLLHIDGDHRDGAWDDMRNYLPKVKAGGIVVVHDYGKPDEYPEVTRAVAFHMTNGYRWLDVVGSQLVAVKL